MAENKIRGAGSAEYLNTNKVATTAGEVHNQVVEVTSIGADGELTRAVSRGLAFSTNTQLAGNEIYSSEVLSLLGYTQVHTSIKSDVAGDLKISFLRDAEGTDPLRTLTIPYNAGSGFKMYAAPAFTPYVKYTFINGSVATSGFYFDTKFTTEAISGQLLDLTSFVSDAMVAPLTRSILTGKDNQYGQYNNVEVDTHGHLKAIDKFTHVLNEMLDQQKKTNMYLDFITGNEMIDTNNHEDL